MALRVQIRCGPGRALQPFQEAGRRAESQSGADTAARYISGFRTIEMIDVATSVFVAAGRQDAQVAADVGQHEGELADLRQRDGHWQRHAARGSASPHDQDERHQRLADQHDGQRADEQAGVSSSAPGSSSMPTETKNSTANASRIGSASDAARRLYSD